MRSPDRIPKVLAVIREAWERNPDLRLGQLIENALGHPSSVFYIEDDKLIEAMDSYRQSTNEAEQSP